MRVKGLVSAVLLLGFASPAVACTYPVTAHPVLSPKTAQDLKPHTMSLRLVVESLLVPQRYAEAKYQGWFRRWGAVRGSTADHTVYGNPGQAVEVVGPLDGSCFYPNEAYERDGEGRLIVWVAGSVSLRDGQLVVSPQNDPANSQNNHIANSQDQMAWVKVRWALPQ